MEKYSITQLSREFDLTTRAIRFYEEQGLITPGRNGRTRVFSQRDRTRLRLVQRGRRLGFSIPEIREILDLYDAEEGQKSQLSYFIEKIRERRQSLHQQQQDILAILTELDKAEARCVAELAKSDE